MKANHHTILTNFKYPKWVSIILITEYPSKFITVFIALTMRIGIPIFFKKASRK